ncbi:MAG TPA: phage tail assembly protein [Thermodesulfobacteriota bacterium]|nr:phage tail assembly protein [Thermodesulfobacteriota bacterium]
MGFQTEFEFLLPKGYVDEEGNLHKKGVMRLATAADEILPMKDPRVQSNPAYLTVILLSRVVTKLGNLETINPKVVENLFAADLSYLQEFYRTINENGNGKIKASCPKCEHQFEVEEETLGE